MQCVDRINLCGNDFEAATYDRPLESAQDHICNKNAFFAEKLLRPLLLNLSNNTRNTELHALAVTLMTAANATRFSKAARSRA